MPWAAPGDTCPQSADGRAGQRSRSGGGQQQQQRPEQQQKSREVARGGWEQHDGLEELPGVCEPGGGLGSQGQARAWGRTLAVNLKVPLLRLRPTPPPGRPCHRGSGAAKGQQEALSEHSSVAGAECLGLGGQRHGGHRLPSPVGLTGRLLADCLLVKPSWG